MEKEIINRYDKPDGSYFKLWLKRAAKVLKRKTDYTDEDI